MQPDDLFPMDDKIKEAYSHVVENTAFFGDVALRFPRIVHHYFDRNSEWGGLLRWGLHFCNQTGVFTGGAHQHVLTLVRTRYRNLSWAAAGPAPCEPDVTGAGNNGENSRFYESIPHRARRRASHCRSFQEDPEGGREEEEKRRERKEIRKGPRISRSRSEL
ncbi:coiled-coil domain-containing protein 134-like isoform X2 [Takifugu flavidus]|uniref:coiled-coil domain-containing protein 134-like isoform X2 n=1 Tax=Takifugu flavidus TaxID=433684 RepID=UPI00254433FB|nr:coiled-coil domain-containing protein 134-like isoform X2 [Takifugu flavidus]